MEEENKLWQNGNEKLQSFQFFSIFSAVKEDFSRLTQLSFRMRILFLLHLFTNSATFHFNIIHAVIRRLENGMEREKGDKYGEKTNFICTIPPYISSRWLHCRVCGRFTTSQPYTTATFYRILLFYLVGIMFPSKIINLSYTLMQPERRVRVNFSVKFRKERQRSRCVYFY